jgi:kumamolisin
MNATIRAGLWLTAWLLTIPALAEPISATLKLKERVSMEQLAANVLNPSSSHYQRFYEPAEIRQLAGPSAADYNDLIAGLKAEGMTITGESPTHLWVGVRGEKAIYESLFATQIHTMGRGMHKPMSRVQIPIHLSLVESVAGLDSTVKRHPHFIKAGTVSPDLGGGIQQDTIKSAYGFNPIYSSGINGSGIHIAIATYNNFHIADAQQFYKLSNLNPIPSLDQVTFNGTPPYDANSAGETELDAEFSGMIAPGASIHVFASATNDDNGELQMYTAILDDNRAKIVNYSWGGCERDVTQQHKDDMNKVFARAVAQGVNVMVASGDSGSDSCQDNTNLADWPAANPYIVAVGGTTFAQSAGRIAETGWNGSGGGVSGYFALPAWQNGFTAPFTKRSYPDVAFNADPNSGQAIYTDAEGGGKPIWMVIGGTSMAAPQWSGFLALVAQARAQNGRGDVGFLNPIIYGLSDAQRATLFHDVTSGSNGSYKCTAGWDGVTGFGSMQADALLNYLQTL